MSRFTWNSARNGRLINRYVDTMCKEFPAIMRQVAKKGIKGDLGSWFEEGTASKAKCGCLVGTTCIVAIDKYNHLTDDQKESEDAAMILYDLVVRKSKRDVSKYDRPEWTGDMHIEPHTLPYDPLLVLIYRAGIAAADEAMVRSIDFTTSYEEQEDVERARHKAVVDHIEHRIRTKLDMPYPKRKRA